MVEFDLVFSVIDDGAAGTSVEGCLRFQPTGKTALAHRVKVLRPHVHVGGLVRGLRGQTQKQRRPRLRVHWRALPWQ